MICGMIVALYITWDYSRWWPTAWKYTLLYHQSTSQETERENEAAREKQALGSLPHSSITLPGNFAASRALYDNPGSSSALISATEVHLRFSLSTIFFNNAISAANYTFHIAHYSLPWRQAHSSPTHFTSGALHAGVSPGSRCSTASFSH